MQLNITGNNVEITEALREFVTAKFAKLEQYFDRINQVYVRWHRRIMRLRSQEMCRQEESVNPV